MPKPTGDIAELCQRLVLALAAGLLAVLTQSTALYAQDADTKLNVLFLAVDDMRDWVGCLGGYAGKVHTPNIDNLASQGINFSNAHCPSPKCAPSRAAIMLGQMPSSTGLYDNGHWWRPNYPEAVSLPMLFQQDGYEVAGAGKIFHHTAGNNPPDQWDSYHRLVFRNDPWFRGNTLNYPWSTPTPNPPGFPFAGMPGLPHENDWGSLPIRASEYDDALTAEFAIQFLKSRRVASPRNPFFLACGIFRPHLPWYAPREFFELYPLDEIQLPQVLKDDLSDVPTGGMSMAADRRSDLQKIRSHHKSAEAVQAYLASISFADYQIGRVLKALENSGLADNTVVVFWSDHGWHLGEKEHWHKSTLWEEATRVPFIIKHPELQATAGKTCFEAVSLIDIYPTLKEICKLADVDFPLDGDSLASLLSAPSTPRKKPAVIEFQRGNAAVRDEQFRYIRYADGGEELYDHASDPHEWHNLAQATKYREQKAALAKWLPKQWAPSARKKKDFIFDPETYSWKLRSDDASQ